MRGARFKKAVATVGRFFHNRAEVHDSGRPSAAKAGAEKKAYIAALKRCATQKQDQVFPQTVKPLQPASWTGTTTGAKAPE